MKQEQQKNKLSLPRKLVVFSLAGLLGAAFCLVVFQNSPRLFNLSWNDLSGIDQIKIESRQEASAEIVSPEGPFFGFGSGAVGGKGMPIFRVQNLNDSGSGSLREALKSGNRVIKFDVSGEISLQSELFIPSNITIDGLSAPNTGISIKNNRVTVRESRNIIIQGIRFRGPAYDTLRIWYGAENIVIDHCSFSGSLDGGLDITEGAHDITLSWNIFSETAGEGKAMLIKYGAYHVSLHHNIFFGNTQRNPQIAGDNPDYYKGVINYQAPIVDLRNNIIWNWESYGTWITAYTGTPVFAGTANVVNNLYSSSTRPQDALIVHGDNPDVAPVQAYVFGNISLTNVGAAKQYLTNLLLKDINQVGNHNEFPVPDYLTQSALEAAYKSKFGAGARPLDEGDKKVLDAIALPDLSGVKPPIAKAGEDKSTNVGVEVVFDASGSYDSDGKIVSYLWKFGDGKTSSQSKVSHIYTSPGVYSVELTVTDDAGLTGNDSLQVSVASVWPPQNGTEKEINVSIISGDGDAYEYGSNPVNLTSVAMNLGKGTKNAFRFQSVEVPKGAIIQKAYLELYAYQYESKSISLEYGGELSGNSSLLNKTAYGISKIPLTQARISDNPGAWKRSEYNQSSNLSSIIQEIVNLDSWSSGNSLTVVVLDKNSSYYRQIRTFEGKNSPRLTIVYQTD